jgi:type IV pilus assembly protein PilY1
MFYVQNNGLLTAIDTANGIEKWSFMIEEALPKIASMIADSAGTQIDVADGTPTVYIEDINGDGNITGSDKVYLYFGLRRGGRVYYAIDITNPDVPTFKWKIDANSTPAKVCVGNGVCTNAPQYNELGQTWSTPFVGKVRASTNPVLVVGGGYDPAEDTLPPGTRTMGRAVYVIDAIDASLVQSWGVGQSGPFLGSGAASMIYPIPSDMTALNTDLDSVGYLDRLYVGDTGGNVWRFDVDSSSVASWNAKLLANLSSDISSGEKRKILFPPAIVKQNSPFRFDAVYVGTGDREHPLCLTANQTSPTVLTNSCSQFVPSDKIFMVIDPDYGLTASNSAPVVVSDLYQRLASDLTTNTSNTILNTNKGWYRNYDNGEKSANAPTVFNQRLRFGTYAPLGQSGGACVPAGEGRLNEIDALTGDFVPINGTVTSAADRYYATFITHGYISTGQLVVQGKNIYHIVVSDSRLQSVLVGTLGSATKIYWYMEPEQ